MSDVRTILQRGVGGAAPRPDAFERMLRRRDRKRRNQRLAAATVGIAVFVAIVVAAIALGSFDRRTNVPGGAPAETAPVFTFFGPDGMVSVDGERVKTTSAHPTSPPGTPTDELDLRYLLDPVIDVPAGARIVVGPDVANGWVDAHDLSEPAERLYELDLAASPSMPEDPGTYFLEFSVRSPAERNPLTYLVPVRVVAPENPSG
jgi:hypothetical protein